MLWPDRWGRNCPDPNAIIAPIAGGEARKRKWAQTLQLVPKGTVADMYRDIMYILGDKFIHVKG